MSSFETTATLTSWCSICRADTTFEQPECHDGHGGDCADWACLVCGSAIMTGFFLPEPARGVDETSDVA